jgi:hypothetical protein
MLGPKLGTGFTLHGRIHDFLKEGRSSLPDPACRASGTDRRISRRSLAWPGRRCLPIREPPALHRNQQAQDRLQHQREQDRPRQAEPPLLKSPRLESSKPQSRSRRIKIRATPGSICEPGDEPGPCSFQDRPSSSSSTGTARCIALRDGLIGGMDAQRHPMPKPGQKRQNKKPKQNSTFSMPCFTERYVGRTGRRGCGASFSACWKN